MPKPGSEYGTGTITWNEKERLWVGRVEFPPVDGVRRRVTRKAKTKAQLAAKMRDLHSARDEGQLPAHQTMTTEAWLAFWTAEVLPGTVAARTEEMYGQVVKDWIAPYVGRIPLASLAPEHVAAMMRSLERKGLSASTQRKARTILRRSLTVAMRYGRVSRNVAALTDPPRQGREARLDDSLDADEAGKVLDRARGDRLEALAVLVLAVGLRQGEALALRWDDLDEASGVLRVRGTKSTASDRTILLPPMASNALRSHHARQRTERMAAPVWADPDLMFTTTVGTAIHRRNALDWWHRLTIAAGVGRRRFHASRHTAATLMLNNGVPLEVISKTLGHAGLAITADIYARVGPQLERQAADVMEQVLGGQPKRLAP